MNARESKEVVFGRECLGKEEAVPLWDPNTGEVCNDALLDLARGIQVSHTDGVDTRTTEEKSNYVPEVPLACNEEDINETSFGIWQVDDCTDKKVSESRKDAHQSTRHLRYLSTMIESERESYCAENAACKALRHEILEKETQMGLAIDSLRLAHLRQSRMIRYLQDSKLHPMLFREFEHENRLLHGNIEHSWNDQAKAVHKRFARLIEEATAEKSCSAGVGTLQLMKQEMNTLENERRDLSKLSFNMSRRSRGDTKLRFQISKVEQRIQELCSSETKLQKELESTSLDCAALEAELLRMEEEIQDVLETNKILQQRVVSAEKEASELELYAAQIHREQEKNRVLNRFVTKHSRPDTQKSDIMETKDRIQGIAHDIRSSLYVLETSRNGNQMKPLTAKLQGAVDELVLRSFKALSREQDTSAALSRHVEES